MFTKPYKRQTFFLSLYFATLHFFRLSWSRGLHKIYSTAGLHRWLWTGEKKIWKLNDISNFSIIYQNPNKPVIDRPSHSFSYFVLFTVISCRKKNIYVYLLWFKLIFGLNVIFLLFLGIVMSDNEFETMKNKIKTKNKIEQQHIALQRAPRIYGKNGNLSIFLYVLVKYKLLYWCSIFCGYSGAPTELCWWKLALFSANVSCTSVKVS